MDPLIVGLIGIAILIILLFSGLSIGMGMALVGFVGFAVIVGIGPALGLLKSVPYNTFAHYDLSVIPLFILMGSFALAAGRSLHAPVSRPSAVQASRPLLPSGLSPCLK
jgi:hypothetical protein